MDYESLNEVIAALYHQLDHQEAVVKSYHFLKGEYYDHKLHIHRIQAELHFYVEVAPRLANYVQQRYKRLSCNNQALIQKSDQLKVELKKTESRRRDPEVKDR